MDFKYTIYTSAYWFWKHYLEQGYPISFKLIEEILSEKDFNTQLKDKYIVDYPQNFNENVNYKNNSYSIIYPILVKESKEITFLKNIGETKNIKKSDLHTSEYNKIAYNFQLHLDFNYYDYAEPTRSPLKVINLPLLDKIIFIDYYNLKGYSLSWQDFIKEELNIFKEILASQGLDYVLFANDLQSRIYHKIRHVNTSNRDIELLGEIDYNVQNLQKEKEYSDYLNKENEVIKAIENEEIRVIIYNEIKASLENRISKTGNLPLSPNLEWFETNWNSTLNNITISEINTLLTPQSDALFNDIVVKDRQVIIFNDIHIF